MSDVTQDIRDRLDVVDVVGSYITLKRAGTNFKASCPFHSEKSASFIVSPQKQIWHCFGCGEGGDIFGFVMKFEGVEFKEALKQLAQKAGVVLPEYGGKSPEVKDVESTLLRINKFAVRFYHEFLLKSPKADVARGYLVKRGLSSETIEQWQIGYAPNEFHALEQLLLQKGVAKDLLVQAGVSVQNEKGMIYDRFRDRVTFPIFNYYGEPVGFTARILTADSDAAKYINSPETPIYNKSSVLFGFNFAKQEIRKRDQVVIVEGQMDCIKAHQAGYVNTVATSGTALTEIQLKALSRLTKNLILCFDGDSAGLKAAQRAGELGLPMGFKIKMVILTDAKDPDELISKNQALWEAAVADARWFMDVYIDHALKDFVFGSVEQTHYIQEVLVPLINKFGDAIEKQHYIDRVAEVFGVKPAALSLSVQRGFKPGVSKIEADRSAVAAPKTGDVKTNALEKQLLGGILVSRAFFEFLQGQQALFEFNDPIIGDFVHRALSGEILDRNHPLIKEVVFVMEESLLALEGNQNAFFKTLEKAFYGLRLQTIKIQQGLLTDQLKQAEALGDKTKALELSGRFAEAMRVRLELEQKL